MKKIFSLLSIPCLVLFSFNTHDKIWRVNNTPGVSADFTSFSLAIASASVLNGDTLHFESSTTDYAGATLTKRLVIIGLGYLLDPANINTNGNAGLQTVTAESQITGFTINDGAPPQVQQILKQI